MTAPGVIDIHHHILPPAYVEALGARMGLQGLTGATPYWSPAISLAAMDRNGIQASVTSISSPGVWHGDAAEAAALARACNEYAAGMVRDHPARFGFFATLPLPDIDAALREVAHAFDTLGAEGVCLLTNVGGVYPGDARFAPLFDELDRRGAVVFFHPTASAGWVQLPEIPWPTLEFPFDTTRAIVSLLMGGTLARCQRARFVFAHAGGAIPFLAERVARLNAIPAFRAAVPDGVRATLARIHVDVALSANPLIFGSLRQVVPDGHILFGSDYPHAGEPTLAATIEGLSGLDLSPAAIGGIARESALALFPALASRIAAG